MDPSIEKSLIEAITKFETAYKNKLDDSDINEEVSNLLYDLGASIKHTFDSFAEIIVKIESQKQ